MLALRPALLSVKRWAADPQHWLWFHGLMTVVWMLLIIPSVVWWRESVPWLVFMSVWANVGSHFGAWQGSRVEVENGDG